VTLSLTGLAPLALVRSVKSIGGVPGDNLLSVVFTLIRAMMLSVLMTASAFGQSPASGDGLPPAIESVPESRQSATDAHWLTHPYLTGDWGGVRSSLADNGVTMDLRYTSFYQGLASGTGDKDFEYGGALFATNTALYWPVGTPEEVVATSLNFTQKVGE